MIPTVVSRCSIANKKIITTSSLSSLSSSPTPFQLRPTRYPKPIYNKPTAARPARAPRTGTPVCWAPLFLDAEEAALDAVAEALEAALVATEAALDAAEAALEVALDAADEALEAALEAAEEFAMLMLVEDWAAARPARAERTMRENCILKVGSEKC